MSDWVREVEECREGIREAMNAMLPRQSDVTVQLAGLGSAMGAFMAQMIIDLEIVDQETFINDVTSSVVKTVHMRVKALRSGRLEME